MARTQVLRPVAAILDSTLWNVKGALHGSHWKDLMAGTSWDLRMLVLGTRYGGSDEGKSGRKKAPLERKIPPATIDPFFFPASLKFSCFEVFWGS